LEVDHYAIKVSLADKQPISCNTTRTTFEQLLFDKSSQTCIVTAICFIFIFFYFNEDATTTVHDITCWTWCCSALRKCHHERNTREP